LPQPGRQYDRIAENSNAESEGSKVVPASAEKAIEVATPLPELFGKQR